VNSCRRIRTIPTGCWKRFTSGRSARIAAGARRATTESRSRPQPQDMKRWCGRRDLIKKDQWMRPSASSPWPPGGQSDPCHLGTVRRQSRQGATRPEQSARSPQSGQGHCPHAPGPQAVNEGTTPRPRKRLSWRRSCTAPTTCGQHQGERAQNSSMNHEMN